MSIRIKQFGRFKIGAALTMLGLAFALLVTPGCRKAFRAPAGESAAGTTPAPAATVKHATTPAAPAMPVAPRVRAAHAVNTLPWMSPPHAPATKRQPTRANQRLR